MRRAMLLYATCVCFASLLLHCGGGSSIVSCTTKTTSGTITVTTCAEYQGAVGSQVTIFKQQCDSTKNMTWLDAQCELTDALGGCRLAAGTITTTTWYYKGGIHDEASAKQGCELAKGEWVSPS